MDYLKQLLKEIKVNYMVRSNAKEKENFRGFAERELIDSGYIVKNDNGSARGSFHIKHKYVNLETESKDYDYIITAHYDTPNKMNLISIHSFVSRFNIMSRLLSNRPLLRQVIDSGIFILLIFLPLLLLSAYNIKVVENIYWWLLLIYFISDIISMIFIPNKNNVNDNTSGVIALLSIARRLKDSEFKNKVKFILLDQEEKGLVGSKGRYNSNRNDFKDKILINLDCIGIGDTLIVSYLNKKDLSNEFISALLSHLEKEFKNNHKVYLKKYYKYSSTDYKSFINSKSISFCLYHKALLTYILPNYHRGSDKYLELEKVDQLVKTITDNINTHLIE